MSEKRLVRLFIGGTMSWETAEHLVQQISKLCDHVLDTEQIPLDGYWNRWTGVTVEKLVEYAKTEKWVELRHEAAVDGVIGIEEWLQEERIPYDEQTPPFGDLRGHIDYYRPPNTRASRICDFFGNPLVDWDEVNKVLAKMLARKYKEARIMLQEVLGKPIEALPFFEVLSS